MKVQMLSLISLDDYDIQQIPQYPHIDRDYFGWVQITKAISKGEEVLCSYIWIINKIAIV